MDAQLKIFAGSSHKKLAQDICDHLGMPLGRSQTIRFSNENMMVQIDENVRECDVFVIQTSCPPVHESLFELLIMNDDLRDMVMRNASTEDLREAARKAGMITLRDSGMAGMFAGLTTAEEIIRETILEA